MVPGISFFKDLPTRIKIGASAIMCVVVLAGMLFLIPLRVLWIVLIGLAVVALLLFFYWRLLKWLNKRKAAPMESGVIQNTAATPQGVNQAANLARLDDLRKKFEEGIAKFHAAGKTLYNFPWYMIVGEPGSGKTEAIRHCNVGFPPGLQDQFQGAGGTLNMNWWFTDHAVVLDTAGRLMFEEADTGGSSEWREFLKLLKGYRPQCPMNGVFLVIPADSLIKDTADEIEEKASKIARQFDMIQRTLDVRFPVFVVITKSDLVNGFRDFFDDLDDPQLQHQILGWSNPAQLDEPYNPDFIDRHLKSIQGRLFRRRLALLQEIVSEAGDPSVEHKRSPDTLYAFPQSLAKIVPRMGRYLELIFSVGSQWSCKPLFFRGIYFTSSMREGSALDEDLAESLGMSVDALPDGRVWERDRAYFLRDLFLKKVFREKGLVTYATNAKKQHMRRKAAVLISAAASVILLLFGTFYAGICLRRSIGEMKEYFGVSSELIAEGDTGAKQLQVVFADDVTGLYRYGGGSGIPDMPEDVNRADFSLRLAGLVDGWEKEGVPWIFAPAAKVASGIQLEEFKDAQAAIYEIGVLQPFFDAAAQKMSGRQGGEWTLQSPDIHVLRQFIRLKAKRPFNKMTGYDNQLVLDPLSEYVFESEGVSEDDEGFVHVNNYKGDREKLHDPIDPIYAKTSELPTFADSDPVFPEAIKRGIADLNEYWADPNQVDADGWFVQAKTIENLKGTFDEFEAAEREILMLQSRFDSDADKLYLEDRWERVAGDWDKSFEVLQKAAEDIRGFVTTLKNPPSLMQRWREVSQEVVKDVNEHYQFLLAELDSNSVQEDTFLTEIRGQLENAYGKVAGRLASSEFEDQLRAIDANSYARARQGDSLYELRFRMYERCNQQFVKNELLMKADPSAFHLARSALQQVEDDIKDANNLIEELTSASPGPGAYRFQEAAKVCESAIKANRRRHLFSIVRRSLESAPKSEADVESLAQEQEEWDWANVPAETVDDKFSPEFAAELLGSWKAVGNSLKSFPQEESLQQTFDKASDEYLAEYSSLCFNYWLDKLPESVIASKVETDLRQWQSRSFVSNVLKELKSPLGAMIASALEPLRQYASPDDKDRIEQFDENLARVSSSRKRDEVERDCRKMLDTWRDLSEKDLLARRRFLLRLTAEQFEDYAPFSYDSPAEFVDMYWAKLSLELLGALAKEVQSRGAESLQGMKDRFGGDFPLERYSEDDLQETELAEAWSSLNDIRLQELFDEGTIGSGDKTGYEDVDERLQLLRGVSLTGSDRQWFDGIEKVLQGLPRKADDPYYCRITLLGEPEQKELAKDSGEKMPDLNWFRIVQGSKEGKSKTSFGKNPIGMFPYPGKSSLKIEFYRYPNDTESHASLEFSGPWAILRMLHQCYDARKQGRVKLEAKSDEGLGGVLFLQLEFFKESEGKNALEFPSRDLWPSLKSER